NGDPVSRSLYFRWPVISQDMRPPVGNRQFDVIIDDPLCRQRHRTLRQVFNKHLLDLFLPFFRKQHTFTCYLKNSSASEALSSPHCSFSTVTLPCGINSSGIPRIFSEAA